MKKYRWLKIHTKFQSREYGGVMIPEIRLEGKWLGDFGFERGQVVKIEQEPGRLVITIDAGERKC